ncbi:MAG: DUF4189 domain-containing protein [Pseudomonadota bacterium]
MALLTPTLPMAPAQAQEFLFGSIAISETGVFSAVNNLPTQEEAEQAALSECEDRSRGCQMATWFRNACGALATAPDLSWGASWGVTVDAAEIAALELCGEYSDQCSIKESLCTANVNTDAPAIPNRGDRTTTNVK